MKNLKIKFKNNQWEDENGVPIAPQDQEKVNRRVWELIIEDIDDRSINNKELRKLLPADYDEWQPEIGKLYDSGDLVFELSYFYCSPEEPFKQFWILKEKAKEEYKISQYLDMCELSEAKEIFKRLSDEEVEKIAEEIVSTTCCTEDQESVYMDGIIAGIRYMEDRIKESN